MTNFFERRLQMRKTIILLTFAAFVGIGSYLVFAQDPMGGGMTGGSMGGGMMNDSERGQQSSGQEDTLTLD